MSLTVSKKSRTDIPCASDLVTIKIGKYPLNYAKCFLTVKELMRTYTVCKSWNNSPTVSTCLKHSPIEMKILSHLPNFFQNGKTGKVYQKIYKAFMDALPHSHCFDFPYNTHELSTDQTNEILSKLDNVTELSFDNSLFSYMNMICLKQLRSITITLTSDFRGFTQTDINNFWSQQSLLSLYIDCPQSPRIFESNVENPCPNLRSLAILSSLYRGDACEKQNKLLIRLKSLSELTLDNFYSSDISKELMSMVTSVNLKRIKFNDYNFLNETNKLISLNLLNCTYVENSFDAFYEKLHVRINLKHIKITQFEHFIDFTTFFPSLMKSSLINLQSLKVGIVFQELQSIIDFANLKCNFKQSKFNITLNLYACKIINSINLITGNEIEDLFLQTQQALQSLCKNPNLETVTLSFQDVKHFIVKTPHFIDKLNSHEEDFVILCLKSLSSKITRIIASKRNTKWTEKIFQYLQSNPLPNCTDITDLTFPGLNKNPNRRQILRQLFPALQHYKNITLID